MTYDDAAHVHLPMWGRWARQGSAPEGTRPVVSSIYELGPEVDPVLLGWGEVTAATITLNWMPVHEAAPIDEEGAERTDCYVRQLPPGWRAVLVQRFVVLANVPRETTAAAIHNLLRLIDRNHETVARMQHLLRRS